MKKILRIICLIFLLLVPLLVLKGVETYDENNPGQGIQPRQKKAKEEDNPVTGAQAKTEINRFFGQGRIETSLLSSTSQYDNSRALILVGYDGYQDALVSAPLYGYYNAPVLTVSGNSPSEELLNEIDRLGVEQIYIIGGLSSVSQNMEDQLRGRGLEVVRLYGEDKLDTSKAIYSFLNEKNALEKNRAFLLKEGDLALGFTISSYLSRTASPIYLVENFKDPRIAEYLKDYKEIILISSGLSDEDKVDIEDTGLNVEIKEGQGIFSTGLGLARDFYKSPQALIFSNADNYPDQGAALSLAQKFNCPIIPVRNDDPDQETLKYVEEIDPSYIFIMGPDKSLPKSWEDSLNQLLN